MNKSERSLILNEFKQRKIQAIAAPRILDEGIGVPEADLGVIIAASKERRQMIQRMGRVLRLKKDGRKAQFLITYVEGTSEDPCQGAHEAFLDEILPIARKVAYFSQKDSMQKISDFFEEG